MKIDQNTLIPLSVLVVVGGFIFWLSTMHAELGHTREDVAEIKTDVKALYNYVFESKGKTAFIPIGEKYGQNYRTLCIERVRLPGRDTVSREVDQRPARIALRKPRDDSASSGEAVNYHLRFSDAGVEPKSKRRQEFATSRGASGGLQSRRYARDDAP